MLDMNIASRAEYMKKYIRTFNGFIKCKYAKMTQRVRGHNGHNHIYNGLPIVDKHIFYNWALNNSDAIKMFNEYKNSGWKYKLCPSIDRIEPKKGYVIGNMRFITMQDNQDLGRINSSIVKKSMTHCRRGHEYTKENTYVAPSEPRRQCRACKRIWASRRNNKFSSRGI